MVMFRWYERHRGADRMTRHREVDDLRRERTEDHLRSIRSMADTVERWDKNPRERQIKDWNMRQLKVRDTAIRSGREKV